MNKKQTNKENENNLSEFGLISKNMGGRISTTILEVDFEGLEEELKQKQLRRELARPELTKKLLIIMSQAEKEYKLNGAIPVNLLRTIKEIIWEMGI